MRIRVTANDKLLLIDALELEPIARERRDIRAVAVLGNDSFPTLLASLSVIGFAFHFAVLSKSQPVFEFNRALQQMLAVSQGQLPRVVCLGIEQIECVKPDRDLRSKLFRRVLNLHARLEFGEAGYAFIESHNLTSKTKVEDFCVSSALTNSGYFSFSLF